MSSSPSDRRKISRIGFFSRPERTPSPLSPIDGASEKNSPGMLKKKNQGKSSLGTDSSSSATNYESGHDLDTMPGPSPPSTAITSIAPAAPQTPPSTTKRPSLRIGKRGSSVLGSFGLRRGEDEHVPPPSTPSSPKAESADELVSIGKNRTVLHHGDAQIHSTWARKKKEYLVLTETHLLRYKNQSKAAESFLSIASSMYRPLIIRHGTSPSVESAVDLQSMASESSGEFANSVPLEQIVAVYPPDEGRLPNSFEIAYLDNDTGQASFVTFSLIDSRERDEWIQAMRAMANAVRLTDPEPVLDKFSHYAAAVIERDDDYNIHKFRIYKVVRRSLSRLSGSASVDDTDKAPSNVCFLVIGVNKIHLLSLPKPVTSLSSRSLKDMGDMRKSHSSHGIMTIEWVKVTAENDDFSLAFRTPLQQGLVYHLSSLAGSDLALEIRKRDLELRPLWTSPTYAFEVPFDEIAPTPFSSSAACGFPETVGAFFSSYCLDIRRLSYSIDTPAEDPLQFVLYPTADEPYSALELLAILRSLRYNESFGTILFAGVSLDPLAGLYDEYVQEALLHSVPPSEEETASLLVSELCILSTSNARLRRIIAPGSLSVDPTRPESSGIFQAFETICKMQYTNVDWWCVNNIALTESDLESLISIAGQKSCHVRGIEVSNCSLTDRNISRILDALRNQSNTLEALNMSWNRSLIQPFLLSRQLDSLSILRKLNLSHVPVSFSSEPLLGLETLKRWRLEELILDGIALNARSVVDLCEYLKHRQSEVLKVLNLNDCSLSGTQVAEIMEAMSNTPGAARPLSLSVSENHLTHGHKNLVRAIEESLTPTELSMQSLDYESQDDFAQLLFAIARNKSLRSLDISRVALPEQAKQVTCTAFEELFSQNNTLTWLDISGEESRLEATRLSSKVFIRALKSLQSNKTLATLVIQHQKLGLEGAEILGEVIRANKTLREISCEHNNMNLTCFTMLVDAVSENHTLAYLPTFNEARESQLTMTEADIRAARSKIDMPSQQRALSSMRRMKFKLSGNESGSPTRPKTPTNLSDWTHQDEQAALRVVSERWDEQVQRLERYLRRNALGLADESSVAEPAGAQNILRSPTSIVELMERVALDRTPREEKQLDLGVPSLHDVAEIDTTPLFEKKDPFSLA